MCFIETLAITCTAFEILAQIDHKGPNWTFPTLKIIFKSYYLYFRIALVSHQKRYMMQYIWTTLRLLLNNIKKYGKMGQTLKRP